MDFEQARLGNVGIMVATAVSAATLHAGAQRYATFRKALLTEALNAYLGRCLFHEPFPLRSIRNSLIRNLVPTVLLFLVIDNSHGVQTSQSPWL
jgi:hypothetical protein